MTPATPYTRKLYLIGPMEARANELVQPLRRKTRALLAYLAAGEQAHSRSFLCNLFLPATDDPLGALNWHFSQIRRRMGRDALVTDADRVQLNNEAVWVDAVEFRRVLERPLVGLKQVQLQAAIDLYRGEFLEALTLPDAPEYELWMLGERAAYRRLYSRALDEIITRLVNAHQYEPAITYAQQRLQLDPLVEEVHRRLIQLYAQTGQRQAAFRQYEQCLRILRDELTLEPSPQLQELHEELVSGLLAPATDALSVRMQSASHPPQAVEGAPGQLQIDRQQHVLPAQRTPFWGRQRELELLTGQLTRGDYRLFTLFGPGGIGKTRLALQLAQALLDATEQLFTDGVYFVPLASVATDELLVSSITDALGLHLSGSAGPLAQLLAYLRTKKLLLVLDNFEQLMASASILTAILEAPGVVLLITSRVRLNLYEEWSLELRGLEAPGGPHEEQIAHYSAVQLFVERARLANQNFVLAPNQTAVAQICQLLEGMPLAIELAAGWLRTHNCTEIVTGIQQDLDFLATDYHNIPDRHRSIRVAFEHSWRLLAVPDRTAFARLSVFRDSFDHNAAAHVAGVTRQTLARLADHSMIARTADERWHIHELLRQFAAEKLAETDAIQVRRRHSAYFAGFVQQRAPLKMTRQEPAVIAEIHLDLENVRAGWHWAAATLLDPALARDGAILVTRYAPMLSYYFERRSRFQEGVQIFQSVAKMMEDAGWHELPDNDPATLDRLLAVVSVGIAEATLCFRLGQLARAGQLAARCISLMRKPQLADDLAAALVLLGRVHIRTGAYEKATECLRQSLDLAHPHQDQGLRGLAFSGLATIASNQGKFDEAEAYYTQSIALFREIDYPREVAVNLNNLGANFVRRNQPRQAQQLCQEALAIAGTLDEDLLLAVVLSGLGGAYRALHEYDQAQSHLAQSLQISRRLGDQRWTTTNLNLLGLTLIDAGDTHVARPYLVEALATAVAIGSMPDALDSLTALAEIPVDSITREQRLASLRFVVDQPATRPHTLARGKRLLAGLQAQAAPTHNCTADDRADAHTLTSLAAQYLQK